MIDGKNYPERLGQMIIINSPSSLAYAWSMISKWLDPVTQQKIRFLRGPDEYIPELLSSIDASELPVEYGGIKVVAEWQWGELVGMKP